MNLRIAKQFEADECRKVALLDELATQVAIKKPILPRSGAKVDKDKSTF
jgi:hypothetical protein